MTTIPTFLALIPTGEEGEDLYAYRGPTLSASTLREEETLENIFSGTVSVIIAKALYISVLKPKE